MLTVDQIAAIARQAETQYRSNDAAAAARTIAPLRDRDDAPFRLIGEIAVATGDDRGAEVAFSRHLARAPRDLPALLALARLHARRGDDRAAMTFYRTALGVATQPGARVDTTLVPHLREGEAFIAAASERFSDHLRRAIDEAGLADGRDGSRIRHSLDLLLGRQELYLQQPSMFYLPGLAQRPFFDREEFEWVGALEADTPAIRDELRGLIASRRGTEPYVQRAADRPAPANPLLDDPHWSAFHLWRGGKPVAINADRCPVTMAALARAPIPVIEKRSPMALFSVLEPGTHIQPHVGLLNTRLICHLPLVVPPGCAIRVGAETREWREGELLIFDDSFEHEAWNRGTQTRVVLLFEIWRPDVTADERVALTRMFEAIDRYQGAAIDQG